MVEKEYANINLKEAGEGILISIEVCVGGGWSGVKILAAPVLNSQHPQFWENPVLSYGLYGRSADMNRGNVPIHTESNFKCQMRQISQWRDQEGYFTMLKT